MLTLKEKERVVSRAYELLRMFDPTKPANPPSHYYHTLLGLVDDVGRSVHLGHPSANLQEACVAQALRELDKPELKTPDQLVAEMLTTKEKK